MKYFIRLKYFFSNKKRRLVEYLFHLVHRINELEVKNRGKKSRRNKENKENVRKNKIK